MATIPTGYVSQETIAREVERATRLLGPEVVRVMYTVGPDTSDEPAIHFRILLTDSAVREEILADVAGQIRRILFEELRTIENWGLRLYVRFRGQSEQEKLNDPAWA